MNSFPVVDRELRVRARQPGTHRLRLVAAGIALLVTGGVIWKLEDSRMTGTTPGQVAFYFLTSLAMFGCLFGGAHATADCLSQEKREGTIGLLFLTDLRGCDVVSGKFAAVALSSFFALVSVFPVMAIPLMMGGVTPAEFWRVMLSMICGLFLALSIGLWVSARSVDSYPALKAALAVIFTVTAGPVLVDQMILADSYNLRTAAFSMISPAFGCIMAFAVNYGSTPSHYWLSELIAVCLGTGLFWHSSRLIVARWKEPVNSADSGPGRRFWNALSRTADARKAIRIRPWLERNPFAWLVLRNAGRETILVIFAGVAIVAMFLQWRSDAPNSVSYGTAQIFTLISAVFLRLMMIARASQSLVDARRNGAMELILCTPLEPGRVIEGMRSALRRSFWVLLAVEVLSCCFQTSTMMGMYWRATFPAEIQAYFLFNGFAHLAVFAADLYALGFVAMWLALSGRSQNEVIGKTFIYVIVAPWLVETIFSLRGRSIGPGIDWVSWGVWPALLIAKDLMFAAWAFRHLEAGFRDAATGLVKPGFWPERRSGTGERSAPLLSRLHEADERT